jgi:hypothetical protein
VPARRSSPRSQLVAAVLMVAGGLLAGVRALDQGFWETTRRGLPLGPIAIGLVLLGAALAVNAVRRSRSEPST